MSFIIMKLIWHDGNVIRENIASAFAVFKRIETKEEKKNTRKKGVMLSCDMSSVYHDGKKTFIYVKCIVKRDLFLMV